MTRREKAGAPLRAAWVTGAGALLRRRPTRETLLAEIEGLRARELKVLKREAFLMAAIESMDVGVIAIDTEGTAIVWNAKARYSEDHEDVEKIYDVDWSEVYQVRGSNGEVVTTDQMPIYRAVRGERVTGEEFDTLISGVSRRLSINAGPITLPDGTTVGAISTSSDISKLHVRERELARANADLDAIATATQQVLNGDDARQAVVNAALAISDAVTAMIFEPTRPTSNTLVPLAQAGMRLEDFEVHRDDVTHTARAFRTGKVQFVVDLDVDAEPENSGLLRLDVAMGTTDRPRGMIAIPVMRDGIPRAVLSVVLSTPLSTSNLRLLGLLELLAADASLAISREDTARELTRLAATDPLTGLANRRSWDERLNEEIERARRTGLPLTVVMLDLDHFKSYNDSRGHQAGDELLAAGAKNWMNVLRSGDTLARLGGEEFGVLLPGCPVAAVPTLVERLIRALPDGQTCSAGVAQWEGEVPAHTIARADGALYEAKRSGRATFRIASNEVSTELPSPRPATNA